MPDLPVEPYESPEPYQSPEGIPLFPFRTQWLASDNVLPPAVPGEVVESFLSLDRDAADQMVEMGVARTDLGRIVLEQRLANDVEGRKDEWRVIHTWTRTAEGWRHQ